MSRFRAIFRRSRRAARSVAVATLAALFVIALAAALAVLAARPVEAETPDQNRRAIPPAQLRAIPLSELRAIPPSELRSIPPSELRSIPLAELRSGSTFQSAATRAEQDDLTTNPGMLWNDQGQKLWGEPQGPALKSCASCHGDIAGMKSVAARYPLVDRATGKLMTIADRVRQCRTERQGAADLAPESEALLSLTTALTHVSRGVPLEVAIDGPAAEPFAAGYALYHQRQGQLNLSCANCHDENWGKRARHETISQGHPNGFPAYRLEWQTLGSLERRLKACFFGVRAEPLPADSVELRQLELYLAWRAQGLPIETPAIRR